METRISI
jgi:hypothetical protein